MSVPCVYAYTCPNNRNAMFVLSLLGLQHGYRYRFPKESNKAGTW